jgi:hypothetical protein
MPVAAFTSITAVIAAISAATALETFKTPMAELGRQKNRGLPASARKQSI